MAEPATKTNLLAMVTWRGTQWNSEQPWAEATEASDGFGKQILENVLGIKAWIFWTLLDMDQIFRYGPL